MAGNSIHNLQVGMEISGDKLLASQSRNERYEFSIIKQTQFFVKKIDKSPNCRQCNAFLKFN